MSTFTVQFGKSVQSLRKAKGLSQEALADRTGFTRPFISQIESGKKTVSLQNVYPLADALEVEPGVLVDMARPIDTVSPLQRRVKNEITKFMNAVSKDAQAWNV